MTVSGSEDVIDDVPRPGDGCTGDLNEFGYNDPGEGQFLCPSFGLDVDGEGSVTGGECLNAEQLCDGVIDCHNYLFMFSGVHDEADQFCVENLVVMVYVPMMKIALHAQLTVVHVQNIV